MAPESTCFPTYNRTGVEAHVIPRAPVQLVIFLKTIYLAEMIQLQYVRMTKNVVFFFPEFKERPRFKGLVKGETEENQVKTVIIWPAPRAGKMNRIQR